MKLALSLTILALPTAAMARSEYMSQVPHAGENSCDTCHVNGGGSDRNAFGADYAQFPDWQQLFDRDSDGDGCTNGEELGDPDGAFVAGGDAPGPYSSNPADGSDCGSENSGCSVTSSSKLDGLILIAIGLLFARRRTQSLQAS